MTSAKPTLDASLRFDALSQAGRTLEVRSTQEVREAIAQRLGIEALDMFAADLRAMPFKGGIEVRGHLKADVTQQCVVSFVPVHQHIEEDFSRVFLPGHASEADSAPGAEIYIDLEGDDLPDYFEGPEVDFSELLIEVLSLAIDPYPRAPDAQLPAEATEDEASPFAVLKGLSSRSGPQGD